MPSRDSSPREPLEWLKTAHAYPAFAALIEHRRKLGEILVAAGAVSKNALERALATCPQGRRIGEHLVATSAATESAIFDALGVQQGLPVARLEPGTVSRSVARALPGHVTREWKVMPFRVAEGNLHVAVPDAPSEKTKAAIQPFTTLEVRFHLVTPSTFEELTSAFL
jgi:bacteriophage N4 adsorption protein B